MEFSAQNPPERSAETRSSDAETGVWESPPILGVPPLSPPAWRGRRPSGPHRPSDPRALREPYLRERQRHLPAEPDLGHSWVKVTERVYALMIPEDFEQDWDRNCLAIPAQEGGQVISLHRQRDDREVQGG